MTRPGIKQVGGDDQESEPERHPTIPLVKPELFGEDLPTRPDAPRDFETDEATDPTAGFDDMPTRPDRRSDVLSRTAAAGAPAEGEPGERVIHLGTRCTSLEDFIAKFFPFTDDETLTVPGTVNLQIGTEARFVVGLADRRPVLQGRCRLIEITRGNPASGEKPRLRLKFVELDDASKQVHRRLVSRKRLMGAGRNLQRGGAAPGVDAQKAATKTLSPTSGRGTSPASPAAGSGASSAARSPAGAGSSAARAPGRTSAKPVALPPPPPAPGIKTKVPPASHAEATEPGGRIAGTHPVHPSVDPADGGVPGLPMREADDSASMLAHPESERPTPVSTPRQRVRRPDTTPVASQSTQSEPVPDSSSATTPQPVDMSGLHDAHGEEATLVSGPPDQHPTLPHGVPVIRAPVAHPLRNSQPLSGSVPLEVLRQQMEAGQAAVPPPKRRPFNPYESPAPKGFDAESTAVDQMFTAVPRPGWWNRTLMLGKQMWVRVPPDMRPKLARVLPPTLIGIACLLMGFMMRGWFVDEVPVATVSPSPSVSAPAVKPEPAEAANPVPDPHVVPQPQPEGPDPKIVALDGRRTCTATVVSRPPGASITWGDRPMGKTPVYDVTVPCGPAQVIVARRGTAPLVEEVDATVDAPITIDTELRPPMVRLVVTSIPPGAIVRVGRKKVGETPATVFIGHDQFNMIRVIKPGHVAWVQRVKIRGKFKRLNAVLKPIPTKSAAAPKRK